MDRRLAYTPSQRASFVELITAYEETVITGIAKRLGEEKPDPVTYVLLRAIYRLNVRGNPGTVPVLAEYTGLSQPTVWRRLQTLEQGGHLRTGPRRGGKGRDVWIVDDMVEKGAAILEDHMDRFRVFLSTIVADAAGDPLAGKVLPFSPGHDQFHARV